MIKVRERKREKSRRNFYNFKTLKWAWKNETIVLSFVLMDFHRFVYQMKWFQQQQEKIQESSWPRLKSKAAGQIAYEMLLTQINLFTTASSAIQCDTEMWCPIVSEQEKVIFLKIKKIEGKTTTNCFRFCASSDYKLILRYCSFF